MKAISKMELKKDKVKKNGVMEIVIKVLLKTETKKDL